MIDLEEYDLSWMDQESLLRLTVRLLAQISRQLEVLREASSPPSSDGSSGCEDSSANS